MSSRAAVLCLAGLAACAPEELIRDEAQPIAGQRLRVVAGNLTAGNNQNYNDGSGMRILSGLHPDVALLQEMRYGSNSPADLRSFVDQTFGPTFQYARGLSTDIPNGVVSRYPILESGDWVDPYVGNRAFTYARIDLPGPVDLWAISVHLLTSSATNRDNEAHALTAAIAQHVPASDYLVIGGDFNTKSRDEAALTTFSGTVVTGGAFPTDQQGDGDTNSTRSKPYDWVLADPDLDALSTTTVIGANAYAAGLVVDTRTYAPLEDLAPARSTDSGAPNMQHMAVVRDFDVPGDRPDVRIDEMLVNEIGADTKTEFLELYNRGTATADLGRWTISDSLKRRHRFATGTTLAPGARLVIFAGASAIPPGLPNAISATSESLGLTNGGDTVLLADGDGNVIEGFTYTSAYATHDGESMNRSPSGSTGPFVRHTALSAKQSSPGTAP